MIALVPGSVVRYPYLWQRQAEAGEIEGRKSRPTAVAFRLQRERGDVLLLFPITTSEPTADRRFVEVPEIERHRAGLDRDRRQWIILDELNVDVAGGSYYLEPDAIIGQFSLRFFEPIMRDIAARLGEIEKVSRR